jgi:signal transduction histidine kinase
MGSKPITFKGNKGHGLGLTHAFKIIQSWDGEISIDSEVGLGTTVKIDLRKSIWGEPLKNFEANAL